MRQSTWTVDLRRHNDPDAVGQQYIYLLNPQPIKIGFIAQFLIFV
jgi:hypothetical protein